MITIMAFTQTDLDNIKKAIASAELSVRIGETLVTYRSTDELLKVKRVIEAELTSGTRRLSPRHQQAVFADG